MNSNVPIIGNVQKLGDALMSIADDMIMFANYMKWDERGVESFRISDDYRVMEQRVSEFKGYTYYHLSPVQHGSTVLSVLDPTINPVSENESVFKVNNKSPNKWFWRYNAQHPFSYDLDYLSEDGLFQAQLILPHREIFFRAMLQYVHECKYPNDMVFNINDRHFDIESYMSFMDSVRTLFQYNRRLGEWDMMK